MSHETIYQGRRWCGTWWPDPEDSDLDPGADVQEWCEYFVFSEEFGEETHKRHAQFYLFTKKKMTLNGVVKALGRAGWPKAWVVKANGTHDEGINYVTGPYEKKDKDGQVVKSKPVNESAKAYGIRPKESGEREKGEWESVRQAAREGRWSDIPARFEICYRRNLKEIESDAKDAEDALEPCGIFYYGHSGAGKSFKARSLVNHDRKQIYLKGWNKWWDKYQGQPLVMLEDADPEKVKGLDQEIKIWADRYAFMPEIKGSNAGLIRPKWIVITSQYSLAQLFKDKETWWALKRRFICVYCKYERTTGERTYVETPRMKVGEVEGGVEEEKPTAGVEDVTGFGGYGMV